MTELLHQRPLASDQVLIEEVDGAAIAYRLDLDRFVSLNESVVEVWQRCDGATSVGEMIASIAAEADAPAGAVADMVWIALDQLCSEGLLAEPVALPGSDGPAEPDGISRRTVMRLAAAGLAVPVVAGILAPSAAAAQSGSGGTGGGPGTQPNCFLGSWQNVGVCTPQVGGGSVQYQVRGVYCTTCATQAEALVVCGPNSRTIPC